LKLRQPGSCLLRQVVRDLEVDVVRRDRFLARPALFDHLDQLVADVNRPAVVPPILEPSGELLRGVVLQDVYVEFTLARETWKGQVATAKKSCPRIIRVIPVEEIELRVQGVTQKEFRPKLPRTKLFGKAPK